MLEYPLSPTVLLTHSLNWDHFQLPRAMSLQAARQTHPMALQEFVCIQLPAVGRTCLTNEVQSFQLPHETADTLKIDGVHFLPLCTYLKHQLCHYQQCPHSLLSQPKYLGTLSPAWNACPSSDLQFPPLGTFGMTGISSAAACRRTKLVLGWPPGRRAGSQAALLTGGLWPRLTCSTGAPSPPSPLASLSSSISAAPSLGHGHKRFKYSLENKFSLETDSMTG